MIRPLSLLLAVLATTSCVQAYTTLLPQRSSYFVGRSVQDTSSPAHRPNHGTSATLTMKKGKANLPPQMRSQYARAQEMESYRKQMIESQTVGKDGLPVFNLYVRTGLKNIWYPCGSFKGDEKSAALAQSYASNGFLSSLSKKQLDAGISGSLYKDLPKLEESIFRGYPQLRKEKKNLEYGYKLNYPGLSKEQEKISVVEVKEQKGGILGGLQNLFGGN
ncbi:hypothetical protein HJC23_013697 [Cyclotella cryptica]|uniref:Uncharacterized protein n=1 Tax=Cyclotella cryptica TaxID=29204 RepID=A0ABD3QVE0_9STRA|eukprot:CCRYP_001553-RA/>CCRYP_001553-RA protein AED:0.11 eAED:0.11 QI:111/1/1/1/1/1/2/434/218